MNHVRDIEPHPSGDMLLNARIGQLKEADGTVRDRMRKVFRPGDWITFDHGRGGRSRGYVESVAEGDDPLGMGIRFETSKRRWTVNYLKHRVVLVRRG